ncbi:uncharacterized protein MONOS_10706 [Monocercomonoides exilis]|uniref:uncharacterized protein n=1 Tax=Monocercomonoides exilis TaxID=2049356 RepID=UPI003559C70F|nr:hypothetical protein MONOS_10706 [Monocercomonoides exilis]|eukprot:MONOS_10706.1-p1 / transcript=MONOS_10706.1 / gene=MONOS_10706 / organism=Monocercomonoides_exilis_PA203 / gene_product=unspecified product / transcript_product=unspecified product / location=Mono_scaffold00497:14051-14874(+) / protein_length=185 / sequence_SO=supercontig / SO=protein_coding / is_pseudo=false
MENDEPHLTTPSELVGDVKHLDDLKEEIDKEFLAFSAEMYRRGKLLIKLHEAVLLENLRKQQMLEKIKNLFESLTELTKLESSLEQFRGAKDLKILESEIRDIRSQLDHQKEILRKMELDADKVKFDTTRKFQDEIKPKKVELTKSLTELQECTTLLEQKQKELITAQLRFTRSLAQIALGQAH